MQCSQTQCTCVPGQHCPCSLLAWSIQGRQSLAVQACAHAKDVALMRGASAWLSAHICLGHKKTTAKSGGLLTQRRSQALQRVSPGRGKGLLLTTRQGAR